MGLLTSPEGYVIGIGGSAIGTAPIAGLHPVDLIPTDIGQGLPAMVANDRHQVIALTNKGGDGIAPEFRYWFGSAVEWSEIAGARSQSQLVRRYSTDENASLVAGVVELPPMPVSKGGEATIAGVIVEFLVRPSSIGRFDGRIPATTELGFSAYTEGWRSPDVSAESTAGQQRMIVRSATLDYVVEAGDIDAGYFPARFSAWLPCRIDDHVRSARAGLLNVRGVEIVSLEVIGETQPSRFS